MRRLLILTASVLALFLGACSKSGADLIVHNGTNNRLWVTLQGEQTLLNGNETITSHYSTSTQTVFTGEVKKKVNIGLYGETFRIWNGVTEEFVNDTTVELKAGEKSHVYCNPMSACLKIINNSTANVNTIKYIYVYNNDASEPVTVSLDDPIEENEEWFMLIDYYSDRFFYYDIELYLDNDIVLHYGDENTTNLKIDQVYTITIEEEDLGSKN